MEDLERVLVANEQFILSHLHFLLTVKYSANLVEFICAVASYSKGGRIPSEALAALPEPRQALQCFNDLNHLLVHWKTYFQEANALGDNYFRETMIKFVSELKKVL